MVVYMKNIQKSHGVEWNQMAFTLVGIGAYVITIVQEKWKNSKVNN